MECPFCDGEGTVFDGNENVDCIECNGQGELDDAEEEDFGFESFEDYFESEDDEECLELENDD